MEYKYNPKTRTSRKGAKILGINNTQKKIKIQNLMRKFYGKRKDKENTFYHNPFPYAFKNANKKRRDNKLLNELGE